MKYSVLSTSWFEREFKRLAKKYPSLKDDLASFKERLLEDVHAGTSLGGGAYKWRIAVRSKGNGRSGGMRVITYLEVDLFLKGASNIFLLSIYDKSEVSSISNAEIRERINSLKNK